MGAEHLDEARRRLDAGDPASALRLAESALAASRSSGAERDVAAAAQLVAECLYVQGDVAAARPLVEEALGLDEVAGDRERLGADLNLLGVLVISEGRPDEAVGVLRRSYDLRAEARGPDDGDTIESLNNVAVALWRTGVEDEAIQLHEDALRRCERALGEDHRRTAETLNALAVKLETRPESQPRARQLYERGLASAEAALGPDSDLVARLLTNVATARINDGEPDSAGPLLERALSLHERHFGPTSRWTAYVLTALGDHAWSESRFDVARNSYERAFVIRVNELGPTDPEALDAALGLVNVLGAIASGPPPAAEDAMNLAAALYLPLLAFHPELADSFPGGAHPDPARAAEQLQHVADRLARDSAPDAADSAAIERAAELTAQADDAYLGGDFASAAAQLHEAISTLEAVRGPSDTALVEPLQRLKLVHRLGGTESAVLPILRRIAAILAEAYGEIHPLAIRALGEVYWQERREYGPAGGLETAARIESLARDALGEVSVVGRLLEDVFAAAREGVPAGTQPDEPPLSVRRERALAEPSPIAEELLPELATTAWPTLHHAYGPAVDTPIHLRLLLAVDERVRDDALDLLGESLIQEGPVHSAAPPVARLIRRLATDQRVPGRGRLIFFLGAAAVVARDAPGSTGDELAAALGDLTDVLRALVATDPEDEVRGAARAVLSELDAGT